MLAYVYKLYIDRMIDKFGTWRLYEIKLYEISERIRQVSSILETQINAGHFLAPLSYNNMLEIIYNMSPYILIYCDSWDRWRYQSFLGSQSMI
jgi:hypothetical protein